MIWAKEKNLNFPPGTISANTVLIKNAQENITQSCAAMAPSLDTALQLKQVEGRRSRRKKQVGEEAVFDMNK